MINLKEKVEVTCYRITKIWNTREEAMRFFYEGMMNSEGSEYERYSKIYDELRLGYVKCCDE